MAIFPLTFSTVKLPDLRINTSNRNSQGQFIHYTYDVQYDCQNPEIHFSGRKSVFTVGKYPPLINAEQVKELAIFIAQGRMAGSILANYILKLLLQRGRLNPKQQAIVSKTLLPLSLQIGSLWEANHVRSALMSMGQLGELDQLIQKEQFGKITSSGKELLKILDMTTRIMKRKRSKGTKIPPETTIDEIQQRIQSLIQLLGNSSINNVAMADKNNVEFLETANLVWALRKIIERGNVARIKLEMNQNFSADPVNAVARIREIEYHGKKENQNVRLKPFYSLLKPRLTSKDLESLTQLVEISQQAKNALVAANLRYAKQVGADIYFSRKPKFLDFEDIQQCAQMGLIRAVELFDFTKGWTFSTYSTNWIKAAIKRGLLNEQSIWIPEDLIADIAKLNQIEEELLTATGKNPTPEDVVTFIRSNGKLTNSSGHLWTTGYVLALAKLREQRIISYDIVLDESSGRNLLDILQTGSNQTEQASHINDYLNNLKQRQKKVLLLLYVHGLTLSDIALLLGVSREIIKREHNTALELIRINLEQCEKEGSKLLA